MHRTRENYEKNRFFHEFLPGKPFTTATATASKIAIHKIFIFDVLYLLNFMPQNEIQMFFYFESSNEQMSLTCLQTKVSMYTDEPSALSG